MRFSKKALLAVFLSLAMGFATACGGPSNSSVSDGSNGSGSASASVSDSENSSSGGSSSAEKTYTVKFMDGETVVKEETGKKGDKIDIPADPTSSDARYTFMGWEGLDASDKAAGKVEIFNEDLTYTAIWHERFGTSTQFTATKLRAIHDITVDGEKDDAYADAAEIPVETVTAGDTETKAKVRFMWDSQYIYVFAEVTDANVIGRDDSYTGGQWTEHNDTFEIWIDLLHNESLASPTWNGGWGGGYRGEPGPMCEAHFKINAGKQFPEGEARFGAGSEACWDGWWSNECNNDGVSVGTTKLTATGYNVEYKIKADLGNIPENLRPAADREIGIGVKIYDKTTADSAEDSKENAAPNAIAMEAINGNMSGPKKLSNVKLVANSNDNKAMLGVKQVRDGFDIEVDGTEDLLYRDAEEVTFGSTKAKLLWTTDKVYVLAALGSDTSAFKLESPLLAVPYEANGKAGTTVETIIPVASGATFKENSTADLTVTYKDGTLAPVTTEYVMKMQTSSANFASPRHMFEAKKLAAGASITVDGDKDAAYGEPVAVIETIATKDTGNGPEAKGKAYITWDDAFLYVFVDVTDAHVSSTLVGDPWQNDSVELWISTCRSFPVSSTGWGDANRPAGNTGWCGEGGFRVLANNIGDVTGSHWMYDWKDGVERSITSKLTETGYTVEYKIAWAAFAAVENKVGEVIDIMININDDNNNDGVREGIVSTNTMGQLAFDKPYVLDHLKLVAAD